MPQRVPRRAQAHSSRSGQRWNVGRRAEGGPSAEVLADLEEKVAMWTDILVFAVVVAGIVRMTTLG